MSVLSCLMLCAGLIDRGNVGALCRTADGEALYTKNDMSCEAILVTTPYSSWFFLQHNNFCSHDTFTCAVQLWDLEPCNA